MAYKIWPYKQGSSGAHALATALGGRVLKRQGSSYVKKPSDIVVNWGDVNPPQFVTKNREHVRDASNKKMFFLKMREKGLQELPPFWLTKEEIPLDAYPVVCRTVLAGHSGDGIVIADSPSAVVPAQLFVKYMKKKDEYRVHLGRKETPQVSIDVLGNPDPDYEIVVISIQKKARRLDVADTLVDWKIRNHQNGFIYKRNDINPPSSVVSAARKALDASGLQFGAVDVIFNEHEGKAYVLEINTAPGIEGQTVLDYAAFFNPLPTSYGAFVHPNVDEQGGHQVPGLHPAPVEEPVPEPEQAFVEPLWDTVIVNLPSAMSQAEIDLWLGSSGLLGASWSTSG